MKKFILILFFIIFFYPVVSSFAVEASADPLIKSTYRYDFKRSGYAKSTSLSPPFRMKWFVNTNHKEEYKYSPKVDYSLIADGSTLFYGTLDNGFCAFDTLKKENIWCFETTGDIHAGATMQGDRIYFGDSNGYIYSLDKSTGEIKWQREFGNEILSSPLIIEDKLYFTDMADTIYCIAIDDGSLVWKIENADFLSNVVMRGIASPSYDGGYLYQGFSNGYLYCYETQKKEEVFRKKVKDSGIFHDVDSPAAIDGDTVFASSFDGSFMAIYADRAKSKWEIKIEGNGYPAFNEKDLFISSSGGLLYKVDKGTGGIIWEKRLSPNLTPPVVTDDYVYVASEDYFYAVDAATGEVKYEYEPGSGINSELCIIGDSIYFISNKGYLYCFKSEKI